MSDVDRGDIRDRLPNWATGRLEVEEAEMVSSALEGDADLKAEAEVVRLLAESRPEVPINLGADIREAVVADLQVKVGPERQTGGKVGPWSKRAVGVPRWALAAAATAVIALGTLEVIRGTKGTFMDDAFLVTLEESPSPWVSGDRRMAGAPMLSDLTDEALASLLEELGG